MDDPLLLEQYLITNLNHLPLATFFFWPSNEVVYRFHKTDFPHTFPRYFRFTYYIQKGGIMVYYFGLFRKKNTLTSLDRSSSHSPFVYSAISQVLFEFGARDYERL